MIIDRLTGNKVNIICGGPTAGTLVIRHPDGSKQVQFKSLLKIVKRG